jgi:hypothetical protein
VGNGGSAGANPAPNPAAAMLIAPTGAIMPHMLTDSTDKTASRHNSADKRSVFSGHRCHPRAHRATHRFPWAKPLDVQPVQRL